MFRYAPRGLAESATDVRDPMSSHILHTSSAVDGPVQVQPGAAHIGDGYRQSSYRPEGDARGFTTGGADLGSRKVAEEAAPVRNTHHHLCF